MVRPSSPSLSARRPGAHLAAFHTAQALIHERTGREAKTHRGVHVQFARLTKEDTHFDTGLRQFLAQAYDLKTLADYATGPEAAVPLERAAAALATARRFVDVVAAVLATGAATPPAAG
jgi:uncharacterized protein (UPF0332 family)